MKIKVRRGITPYKLIVIGLLCGSLLACSTKMNTPSSRAYHELTTRYNIYYNAQKSYDEILEEQKNKNTEQFTPFISITPTPPQQHTKTKPGGPFDVVVEKCMKAIQLHSITAKPKRKPGVERTDAYRDWLKQQEYNPYIKHVWMLLGKAHFQNQDYDEAISVFKEIEFLYQTETDVVTDAQLWCMATYLQKGWLYDADILRQIIQKRQLTASQQRFFNQTYVSLLIAQQHYERATQILEETVDSEKNVVQQQRIYFLLGQLMAHLNNPEKAFLYFNQVGGLRTPTPLFIESLLAKANLTASNDTHKATQKLKRLAEEKRYAAWSGNIHLTLATASIRQGDTIAARDYLQKASSLSTKDDIKNEAFVALGNLYFDEMNFREALHHYDNITTLDSLTPPNIVQRSEALRLLVSHLDIIHREDSLQHLAQLSESERSKIIRQKIRQYRQQQGTTTSQSDNRQSVAEPLMTPTPFAQDANEQKGITSTSYFDNSNQVENGKAQFRLLWGNRSLQDNWRTNGRQSVPTNKDSQLTPESNAEEISLADNPEKEAYYLKEIPLTTNQLEESNAAITENLLSAAQIAQGYPDLFDYALSLYNRLIQKYPASAQTDEALYDLYLIYLSRGNMALAHQTKQQLQRDFAQSEWAQLVSEPDFETNMLNYSDRQEALYSKIYGAFKNMDMHVVHQYQAFFARHFNQSTYLSATTLMDALAWAYEGEIDRAKTLFQTIVTDYPETLQAELAKILLETLTTEHPLINPTQESNWTTYTDIIQSDSTGDDALIQETKSPIVLLLLFNQAESTANDMLYNVASYTYSAYSLKTFSFRQKSTSNLSWIEIGYFESPQTAEHYTNGLTAYLDSLNLSESVVLQTTESIANNIATNEQIERLLHGQQMYEIAKGWLESDMVPSADNTSEPSTDIPFEEERITPEPKRQEDSRESSTTVSPKNRLEELERKANELLNREREKRKQDELSRVEKLKKRRTLLKERERQLRQKQQQRQRELKEKRRLREQQLKNRR